MRTDFKDMYCLGFNYHLGLSSNRELVNKHMSAQVAYCNYTVDAPTALLQYSK